MVFTTRRRATSLLAGLALPVLALGLGAFGPGQSAQAQEAGKAAFSGRPNQDTGWQNGGDYKQLGSPNALRVVKDRPLKISWASFPPTLRTDGPNSNLIQTRVLHGLLYESLIGIHPDTEEFMPQLAKEWRIQTDFEKGLQTFWFRLDERAKFSTGEPVLAKDVHASWWHKVSEDRKDPSNSLVYGQFDEPTIVDERTIKVTTKKMNWRLFLYFGGIQVMPEQYVKISGDEYIRKYDWEFIPGSGPYVMDMDQLKKGESLEMVRRSDWWAEEHDVKWARNTYNFHRIKCVVVRDRELLYEKFKADEFDHFRVGRAQRWVEEIPKEKIVQNGWVKRRKIFNQAPNGFSGIVFNMRKPPFNDKNVRLAFAHLFNREKLIDKLFFNQYEMIDSYFPGRDWGNADKNKKIRFDPQMAEEYLFDAGYMDRDDDGFLIGPDGKRLSITLVYGAPSWQRIWLVVKEDYEKAGIELKLKEIDYATLLKNIGERNFSIHFQSWGALLFPNPRTSWQSDLADKTHNNNIPGFKNAEVDKLLELYDVTFDRQKQKEITRKIDELVFQEHPYALGWYANYERVLFWDRFGHPEKWWSRIGDDPDEQILAYWWFDPAKIERLENARKNGEKLPQGQVEHRPWAKTEK
jgi:microcin C transport system substrate-binding protein